MQKQHNLHTSVESFLQSKKGITEKAGFEPAVFKKEYASLAS